MVQKGNRQSTQEIQIDIDTNYAVEIAENVFWEFQNKI